MTSQRISVVLPVYNEHLNIEVCLRGLAKALADHEHEILVCYDFDEDSTLPAIAAMSDRPASVRLVKNTLGRGAANALRAGFTAASGDVLVTTMADLSDPPELIPAMAEKMRREKASVVSGSRYVKGGSQTGGPLFKRVCSQTASLTLHWLSGMSTHDATSNFRAYSREFIDSIRIESEQGFEIALELTVKAHLQQRKVAEVPSSWMDRSAGESRFRLWKWAPNYLRWYSEAMAAPLFVWTVFAAMLAAAFVFIARYSSTLPVMDDLEWAPFISRAAHIPASWWWSPFNEHRIPLPRVIFLALVWTTHDIRSGMYFDVVVLGIVSLAMILLARKLRGRTSYADAFFPLLWLTWGNAENLLMMHQLSLIVPSAITCVLLILFTASPAAPSWKKSLAIGACLFVLPLCGAPGLTPAPAIALWCAYAGWQMRKSGAAQDRRSSAILFASAVATFALIAVYFVDFPPPTRSTYNRDPVDVLRQAWMFLTLGFGPISEKYWPLSGWVLGAFVAASVATLAVAFRRQPSERLRIAGFFAIAAGIASMAISTGIARGGDYAYAGFALRYVTLPGPFMCCIFLASCLYGPAALGQLLRVSLCSILLAVLFYGIELGARYGEHRATITANFCVDREAGASLRQLAVHHWQEFYNDPQNFEERLRALHRANFGPLAGPLEQGVPPPYPMFITQPMLVSAPRAGPRKLGDESVLLVPPGCDVTLSSTLEKTVISGRFGIHPGSLRFTHAPGMRFMILLQQHGRPQQTLFERTLNPEEVSADAEDQRFTVELPPHPDGAIVLRTMYAGYTKDRRAYCYWTAVELR